MINYLYYLGVINLILYFGCAIAQGMRLLGSFICKKRSLLVCCYAAVGLHGYLLYKWIDTIEGQNLSINNLFSMITWISSICIFFVSFKKPLEILVLFILPIAGASLVPILVFQEHNLNYEHLSPASLLHILISIVAFSTMCLAGLQAITVSIQNQLLRKNILISWLKLLPPLETMEALLFKIIWIGFVLLSISFAIALIYLNEQLMLIFPKMILSTMAWILFAGLLLGRHKAGWRGPLATQWTLLGVSILFIAYFGTRFWMENF